MIHPNPLSLRKRAAQVAAIASLTVLSSASAQIVVDDFESYAPGALSGGGWTVSSNYGSATAEVQAGGLDYTNGDLSFSGGSQSLLLTLPATGAVSDPSDDFVGKSFASQGSDGSAVYFRYTFQQSANLSFINVGVSGDGAAAAPSRVSSAATVLRGTDQFRAWDASGSSAAVNAPAIDNSISLVIGRVTFDGSGNEAIEFTLNPASLTEGSNTWTSVSSDLGVTSFGVFGVFANRNDNGTLALDNIVVGESWGDVTGVAIPEPSTYAALAGALALGMVALRRRRKS